MVSISKLIDKMRRNPEGIKYNEFDKVMRWCGYHVVRGKGKGSHIFYDKNGEQPLPISNHGKHVKPFYVKRCLEIVDKEEF